MGRRPRAKPPDGSPVRVGHCFRPTRLDCHSYSTAILPASVYAWKDLSSLGCLMPFGTKYLRMKADCALAASTTDGSIRLQLLNLAEHYDREAEENERQHHLRADKATTSH